MPFPHPRGWTFPLLRRHRPRRCCPPSSPALLLLLHFAVSVSHWDDTDPEGTPETSSQGVSPPRRLGSDARALRHGSRLSQKDVVNIRWPVLAADVCVNWLSASDPCDGRLGRLFVPENVPAVDVGALDNRLRFGSWVVDGEGTSDWPESRSFDGGVAQSPPASSAPPHTGILRVVILGGCCCLP